MNHLNKVLVFIYLVTFFYHNDSYGDLLAKNTKVEKIIEVLNESNSSIEIDQNSDSKFMTIYGNSYYKNKDLRISIPSNSVPLKWIDSTFQTDYYGGLKIETLFVGTINLLPSTVIKAEEDFIQPKNIVKRFFLESGHVRVKTSLDFYFKDFKLYKAIVDTPLGSIFITQNTDVFIYFSSDVNQKPILKIQNVVGDVDFQFINQNQKIGIPVATSLLIENTKDVPNFKNLDFNEIDLLKKMTLLKSEIEASTQEKLKKQTSIKETCRELLKKEDYFEILNTLDPFAELIKKDAELSYCFGKAKHEFSQNDDAKLFYEISFKLDPKNYNTLWNLALIYNEEKNYSKSQEYLDLSYKILPKNDLRRNDYDYYNGVNLYFQNKILDAKTSFESLIQNGKSNPELKKSALNFLSLIFIDKPYKIFMLGSFGYDSNILSIPDSTDLSDIYSQKWGLRSTFATGVDYNSSQKSTDIGYYPGGNLNAFYIKNWTKDYSKLDAVLLQSSFYLINRSLERKEWNENLKKIYSTFGIMYLDMNFDSYFVGLGYSFGSFDFSGKMNLDNKTNDSRKNVELAQSYIYNKSINKYSLSINSQLFEKIYIEDVTGQYDTYQIFLTGSVFRKISGQFLPKFGLSINPKLTRDLKNSISYDVIPEISAVYIFNKNMLTSAEVFYDFTHDLTKGAIANKVGFSINFIGSY